MSVQGVLCQLYPPVWEMYALRPCRVSLQDMMYSLYYILYMNASTVICQVCKPVSVCISRFVMRTSLNVKSYDLATKPVFSVFILTAVAVRLLNVVSTFTHVSKPSLVLLEGFLSPENIQGYNY